MRGREEGGREEGRKEGDDLVCGFLFHKKTTLKSISYPT